MTAGFKNSESSRYAGRPLPHDPEHPVSYQSTSAEAYQPLCISGQVMPEPYETCEATSTLPENPQNRPTASAADDIYEPM